MKKIFPFLIISILCLSLGSCKCDSNKKDNAKYVFYFIGDGMGLAHVSIAQAYLSYKETGNIGMTPLSFTQFPVMGFCTTYSASNWITDSAAAGTALATGEKTTNYMIGMSPDSTNLKSIAYKIKEQGFGIGITSTVSIDQATPAVFYANSSSRNDYYAIGKQLAQSGFDFFAGVTFKYPTDKWNSKKSLYNIISESGYTLANGYNEFKNKYTKAEKMVLIQDTTLHLVTPYTIDRPEGALNGEKLTQAAITFLEKNYPEGFFIMNEGGAIDWSSHVNDAKTTILEMIDFSKAVSVAIEFAKRHPHETLIVVTADHETGGLTLGKEKGYVYDFAQLEEQTHSKELLSETPNVPKEEVNSYIKFVDNINEKAKIGWASKSHTGCMVPIFAMGINSHLFAGQLDNTDVPKLICKAMGIDFEQQEK